MSDPVSMGDTPGTGDNAAKGAELSKFQKFTSFLKTPKGAIITICVCVVVIGAIAGGAMMAGGGGGGGGSGGGGDLPVTPSPSTESSTNNTSASQPGKDLQKIMNFDDEGGKQSDGLKSFGDDNEEGRVPTGDNEDGNSKGEEVNGGENSQEGKNDGGNGDGEGGNEGGNNESEKNKPLSEVHCPGYINGKPECSGKGICKESAGKKVCECDLDRYGEACEMECKKDDEGRVCSGQGVCDKSSGVCKCNDAFYGSLCSVKYIDCPNEEFKATLDPEALDKFRNCGNRGICNRTIGECYNCEDPFYGSQCHLQYIECEGFAAPNSETVTPCGGFGKCERTTGRCQCDKATRRTDESNCKYFTCPDCGEAQDRGKCDEKTGQCACFGSFFGEKCALKKCKDKHGKDTDCNTKSLKDGKKINFCNTNTGLCQCGDVWSGADCYTQHCVGFNYLGDGEDCSGRGQCDAKIYSKNEFSEKYTGDLHCSSCDGNYHGTYCQDIKCSLTKGELVIDNCSGSGTCVKTACLKGKEVCSMATCACMDGYSGLACEHKNCPGFGTSSGECYGSRGECIDGICKCFSGYAGDGCEKIICPFSNVLAADGSIESQECGSPSRGTCDYNTGSCNCNQGYENGEGKSCELKQCALTSTNPPETCYGRGQCHYDVFDKTTLTIGHCVCDHEGWNASKDCKECIAERYGTNCMSKRCFVDADKSKEINCGSSEGRGFCDTDGICKCTERFDGPNCICPKNPNGICSGSARGECNQATGTCSCKQHKPTGVSFRGHECEITPCPHFDGKECSGRGTCVNGKCECQVNFAGNDCSTCAPNFQGEDCGAPKIICKGWTSATLPDGSDNDKYMEPCGGYGKCNYFLGACESCTDSRRTPESNCQLINCEGDCGSNAGRGQCNMNMGKCECKVPYFNNGPTEANCESEHCRGNCNAVASIGLPNDGSKNYCDTALPAKCICTGLWSGENCDVLNCEGYNRERDENCSGISRGKCIETLSSEKKVCQCEPGFWGSKCQNVKCSGELQDKENVFCSGNGVCIQRPNRETGEHHALCECKEGYHGRGCEYQFCLPKTLENDGLQQCYARGQCNAIDGTCLCSSGFEGTGCEYVKCKSSKDSNGNLAPCGRRGWCDRDRGVCACEEGYEGEACDIKSCKKNNGVLCFGNANGCIAEGEIQDYKVGICDCKAHYDPQSHCEKCLFGWGGTDCGSKLCTILVQAGEQEEIQISNCGESLGRGKCLDGTCICNNGFDGPEQGCAIHKCKEDCNGRGVCDTKKGICQCHSLFFGEACEKQHCPVFPDVQNIANYACNKDDPNSACECGGTVRGHCDYTKGTCVCESRFASLTCGACSANFQGEMCGIAFNQCKGWESDPNSPGVVIPCGGKKCNNVTGQCSCGSDDYYPEKDPNNEDSYCKHRKCNGGCSDFPCNYKIGKCVCGMGYYGENCQYKKCDGDCNHIPTPYEDLRQQNKCDKTTGKCACGPNWTGDNCRDIANCDCSNRGKCIYNVQTYQIQCVCEDPYFGDKCENIKCPGKPLPCTSVDHGECIQNYDDFGISQSAFCKCKESKEEQKWGADCNNILCPGGILKYSSTVIPYAESAENECYNHGTADRALGKCTSCNSGYLMPTCKFRECPSSYIRNTADPDNRIIEVCGGRGECIYSNEMPDSPLCKCQPPFSNSASKDGLPTLFACNYRLCPSSPDGRECFGKGVCTYPLSSSVSVDMYSFFDSPVCKCVSNRFDPSTHCKDCIFPYYGENCEHKKCVVNGDIINCGSSEGRGFCDTDGICKCTERFDGPNCICPKNPNGICSGSARGECNQATGTCSCKQHKPTGVSFRGHECEITPCPHFDGKECSGRGTCVNGKCECQVNFAGNDCSTCAPNFQGEDCGAPKIICKGWTSATLPDGSDNDKYMEPCGGYGKCNYFLGACESCTDSRRTPESNCQLINCEGDCGSNAGRGQCNMNMGKCECKVPYFNNGPTETNCESEHCRGNCNAVASIGLPNDGSKNYCDTALPAKCVCTGLWSGENCDVLNCEGYNRERDENCSGRGSCMLLDGTDKRVCKCSEGYRGSHCQHRTCLDDLCGGHGRCAQKVCDGISCRTCNDGEKCTDAECECDHNSGFYGPKCNKLVCPGPVIELSPSGDESVNECFSLSNPPHGTCSPATGQCSCYRGYGGVDKDGRADCHRKLCPFSLSQSGENVECGGRGSCQYELHNDHGPDSFNAILDFTKPKCNCEQGFESIDIPSLAACQRISCPTVDKKVCYGHGQCQFSDAFDGLDAFKLQKGVCVCDLDTVEEDVTLFDKNSHCRSCIYGRYNEANLCRDKHCFLEDQKGNYIETECNAKLQRGRCSSVSGLCECKEGYQSAEIGCKHKSCPKGQNGSICSGQGACDHIQGLCKCNDGFKGISCSEIMCPMHKEEECGGEGRGTCIAGVCDCKKNFASENCGECSSEYENSGLNCGLQVKECRRWGEKNLQCGGYGDCDTSIGKCKTCSETSRIPYHLGNLTTVDSACEYINCPKECHAYLNRGGCVFDTSVDGSKRGRCECKPGYTGEMCEHILCESDCNVGEPGKETGNKCDLVTGKCICVGRWSNEPGWVDSVTGKVANDNCRKKNCVGYIRESDVNCLNRGECVEEGTFCKCGLDDNYRKYYGSHCQFVSCPFKIEESKSCDGDICTNTITSCAGNGICSQKSCTEYGGCQTSECDCSSEGYSRPGCEKKLCPGKNWPSKLDGVGQCFDSEDPNVPSRGKCDSTAGECICAPGFTGKNCQKKECPRSFKSEVSTELAACGGPQRGTCRWDDDLSPKCNCNAGFVNYPTFAIDEQYHACQVQLCDDPLCHGHGTCLMPKIDYSSAVSPLKPQKAQCICASNWDPKSDCKVCLPGWTGPNCNLKQCTHPKDITKIWDCGSKEEIKRGRCNHMTGSCECIGKFNAPDKNCLEIPCYLDCSYRGQCLEETFQGLTYLTGICTCKIAEAIGKPYFGVGCEKAPCPLFKDEPCGGLIRGTCVENTGADIIMGKCQCNEPFTGENCGTCINTRQGENCEKNFIQCRKWTPNGQNDPLECGGLGKCDTEIGICKCTSERRNFELGKLPDTKHSSFTDVRTACQYTKCETDCGGETHGWCDYNTGQCKCLGERYHGEAKRCEYLKCPDNCSGRGKCDKTSGVCSCESSDFNSNVWSGAKCEIENCIGYDRSTNSNCGGLTRGYCTLEDSVKKCVCNSGFYGAHCQKIACPNGTVNPLIPIQRNEHVFCSGNGECVQEVCKEGICRACSNEDFQCNSSKCQCKSKYSNDECSHKICPPSLENECSGHGVCHTDGTCHCNSGYNGDGCQYTMCPLSSSSFATGKDTPIKNIECGGRGICDHSNGFEHPVCVCDPLYTGYACEQLKCPVRAIDNKECSGRGECRYPYSESSSSSVYPIAKGQCKCEGNYDPSTDCYECLPGFEGADCSIKLCKIIEGGKVLYGGDAACGHGKCVNGICVCNREYFQDEFKKCSKKKCPEPTNGESGECNNRGICNYETGICTCTSPSYGDGCEYIECPKIGVAECGGDVRGSCLKAKGECVCKTGHEGESCERCTDAFISNGGVCQERIDCPKWQPVGSLLPLPCGGEAHGTCDERTGACSCKGKSTGKDCQGILCYLDSDSEKCDNPNRASCDYTSGKCICKAPAFNNNNNFCDGTYCMDGEHKSTCNSEAHHENHCNFATGRCTCNRLFIGTFCENEQCPGYNLLGNSVNCFGRGDCKKEINGKKECECRSGAFGDKCQYVSCPKPVYPVTLPITKASFCSNHGTCVQYDCSNLDSTTTYCTASGCECDKDFYGPGCEFKRCPGPIENECYAKEGRGVCNKNTGSCECSEGYKMDSNSKTCIKYCPMSENASKTSVECGGDRGECDYSNGIDHPVCICKPLYEGDACERQKCPIQTINNKDVQCNGHGTCVYIVDDSNLQQFIAGECKCHNDFWDSKKDCSVCLEDYKGDNCETKKCWSVIDSIKAETRCFSQLDNPEGQCTALGECVCNEPFFAPEEGCRRKKCKGACREDSYANGRCDTIGLGRPRGTCVCKTDDNGLALYNGDECQDLTCPLLDISGSKEMCGGGRGECDTRTGKCKCNGSFAGDACGECKQSYYGDSCQKLKCTTWKDENGVAEECGGETFGTCDHTSGICQCKDGRDTKTHCQFYSCLTDCNARVSGSSCDTSTGRCKCQDPYFGDDCKSKKCPSDCNVGDGKPNMCDHNTGTCVCGGLWSGQDCSKLNCVNYNREADQNCLGRGTCIFESVPRCVCNDLYFGDFCQFQMCPGSFYENGNLVHCSGNGECIPGNPSTCRNCKAGFFGLGCEKRYCGGPDISNECYSSQGHGTCNHSTGVCKCNDGFKGEFCKTKECPMSKDQSQNLVECGGRGTCQLDAQNIDKASCQCEADYEGIACELKKCPTFPNPGGIVCRGPEYGICSHPNAAAGELRIGKCTCIPPYYGHSCDQKQCPKAMVGGELKECGGEARGTCYTNSGTCECLTNPRTGMVHFDVEHNCGICRPEFTGDNCNDIKCFSDDDGWTCSTSDEGASCDYTTGTCICSSHWEGTRCDRCKNEFFGDKCQHKKCVGQGPEYCNSNAEEGESHGSCDYTTGLCKCVNGWYGKECQYKDCDPPCVSGNGHCKISTGTCECLYPRFFGETCAKKHCGSFDDSKTVCHGRGVCNTSQGLCDCQPGYYGDMCESIVCPKTNGEECNKRGRCDGSTGKCTCDIGWSGADCTTRVCSPPCTENGKCIDSTSGVYGRCQCTKEHWIGNSCEIHECIEECLPGVPCSTETGKCVCDKPSACTVKPCGQCQHGTECDLSTGLCKCDPLSNFKGPTCNEYKCNYFSGKICNGYDCMQELGSASNWYCSCPGSEMYGDVCQFKRCPNNCNGRGTCNTATGKCKCDYPYFGTECESKQCIPANCVHSNGARGTCNYVTGICNCQRQWYGSGCQYVAPKVVYEMFVSDRKVSSGGWSCADFNLNKQNSEKMFYFFGSRGSPIYLCYYLDYFLPGSNYITNVNLIKDSPCPPPYVDAGEHGLHINAKTEEYTSAFSVFSSKAAQTLKLCADKNVVTHNRVIVGFGYQYFKENCWTEWFFKTRCNNDNHRPKSGYVRISDTKLNEKTWGSDHEIWVNYKFLNIGNPPFNRQIPTS
eukprot:Nk52_evm22s150 gene=Nk52_evmTU22s150